jgi:membrane-bound lytic murein transglycosylase B
MTPALQRLLAFTVSLLAVLGPANAAKPPASPDGFDVKRPEIRAFAEQVARNKVMSRREVLALLAQAKPLPSIIEAMDRPAERVVPWWQYRERFLTEKRIAGGVAFWDEHRELLERVAAERGVPAEYLIAIIGVETAYGSNMGRYRVLDTLSTLSFDYPSRGEYFRRELEQFLMMVRDKDADALQAKGSYAGAMGAAQFMPSRYRRYAIDASNDGRRDLWTEWDDILVSIANYFAEHGWRRDEPVMVESVASGGTDDPLSFQLALTDTVGAIRQRGYVLDPSLADTTPAVLVPAEQPDSMAWRVGFQNFYVITRYNRSSRYAMAVHDLAQALVLRVQSREPGT